MRKRILVGVALGAVALLVGGALTASNMGFKLTYQLTETPPITRIQAEGFPFGSGTVGVGNDPSQLCQGIGNPVACCTGLFAGCRGSGQNDMALPYNQATSLVLASNLEADIEASAGATLNFVTSISRLVKSNDTLFVYPPQNFTLGFEGPEGLRIAVSRNGGIPLPPTNGAPVDYTAVGTHDPGAVILLRGTDAVGTPPASAISKSGQNFFAYPYHAVAGTAAALEAEIEALAGRTNEVTSISVLVRADDTLRTYPPQTFNLTPGEQYIIALQTAPLIGVTVPFTPAHY